MQCLVINSTLLSYNVVNLNDLASSAETTPCHLFKKEGKNNKILILPSFDKSRSATKTDVVNGGVVDNVEKLLINVII